MDFDYHVFSLADKNSRFEEKEQLQEVMEKVLEDWAFYIKDYVYRTNELFGFPEFPWSERKSNERVLVSTLASAIIRGNATAIITEELPVTKLSSGAVDNIGRCDLWGSIAVNSGDPLNFYLEAKKFRRNRRPDELGKLLQGSGGISRMLRDYAKSRDGIIDQRSFYSKERPHKHYVFGLIAVPLNDRIERRELESIASHSFSQVYDTGSGQRRKINRFKTVAMYVEFSGFDRRKFDTQDESSAMFVSLTVLGKSVSRKPLEER